MADHIQRKPLVLGLIAAAAITAAIYTYHQYTDHARTDLDPATSLHRSNAIRRRRGSRPLPVGDQLVHAPDPIRRAILNLRRRNQAREGYGQYHNIFIFATEEERRDHDLTLLPYNLGAVFFFAQRQFSRRDLTQERREFLRLHICSLFIQNFLRGELPPNFRIGDDVAILAEELQSLLIDPMLVMQMAKEFDEGNPTIDPNYNPLSVPSDLTAATPPQIDGVAEDRDLLPREALQALGDRDQTQDDSEIDWFNEGREEDPAGSQNMLDLLYHIAGEQARREGYIHRGVECNGCGVHPIAGIRYHCANCFDFDLCESCEASYSHVKSHVFFKIRIPAPSRGNVKQVIPKWYPGVPDAFPTLPLSVSKPLLEKTSFERTELDALYEQFKCIAGHYTTNDPTGLGVAIDRKGFDAYFMSTNAEKVSPSNLIYNRIFAFYDTDRNFLITFDEYVRGLDRLQDKSRFARLKRIFEGYDLDGDGYVDRKDFLRMFRAYYALSKELSREMISSQGDFGYSEEELREVVEGSQPISGAFGGANLFGHESRAGHEKRRQPNGELQPVNGTSDVLQPDGGTNGDRARAIGNAALRDRSRNHPFRSFREEPAEDEPVMMTPHHGGYEGTGWEDDDDVAPEELVGPDAALQRYPWPPHLLPTEEDIIEALGHVVALEDITDPVDRTRVLYAQSQRIDAAADQTEAATRGNAVEERWRRREFYLDEEEGMSRPPGYTEPDSSDDGDSPPQNKKRASPRRPSMASRSSSRVRFDDSAIDTDYETRSNTSSRSIPVNERWGGYELSHAEADIGKDILYQAVQQGFNQLLDSLFKYKEDEYMQAAQTRKDREVFLSEKVRFGRMLEANDDFNDPVQVAEIDAIRRRNAKEEARYEAARMTGHLGANETVVEPAPDDLEDPATSPESSKTNHEEEQHPTKHSTANLLPLEEPYRDPTMPQFRPDDAESSAPVEPSEQRRSATSETLLQSDTGEDESDEPGSSVPSRRRLKQRSSSAAKPIDPFTGGLAETRNTYYTWLRHDLIDAEARRRGGGGKLNIAEFRRKMAPQMSELLNSLDEKSKGTDEDKEMESWESSADLGKLAFVGTWLEMASF